MNQSPLEYALIQFEGNKFSGEIVPELLDLAKKGIVRYVDLVFIKKNADGSIENVELNDLTGDLYKAFVPLGQHLGSLFSQQDLEIAAGKLPKNSSALLALWENLWSDNIRKAVANSRGTLVERGQVPGEVIEEIRRDYPAPK